MAHEPNGHAQPPLFESALLVSPWNVAPTTTTWRSAFSMGACVEHESGFNRHGDLNELFRDAVVAASDMPHYGFFV
jgi:hypothetical protein